MSAQAVSPVRPETEVFLGIFRRHPAGVAVVTLRDPVLGHPVGFTATSVISVSADPPTLAFSISRGSSSWPALAAVASVVVNFLDHSAHELSSRFATHGIDRFAGVDWTELDGGEPVLGRASSWVRATIVDRHPTADSALVVARIDHGAVGGEEPLVFYDRGYHRLRSVQPATDRTAGR
ncbi:flavin reductase (DIM6/NTAB) family NADH-FMN oxidoreductase RutF [Salana multivorans]|uniref:Flavin reductase (DIM6/NTAB) family NADH-FMN oxidoreductase RutF n=1 Tax=Salana multivorans TaxID=120377 RepID=A0A3N2D9S2_9MICO|nr:flavin reductase family protein [Salana multivorans]ROR96540.1 flavin reductase (DIM6/NTAB) family NADH-FMN oxidoreductase RutF [Salana multivorans]